MHKGAQNDGKGVTWANSAHLGSSKRRKNDHKGCEADCAERLNKLDIREEHVTSHFSAKATRSNT